MRSNDNFEFADHIFKFVLTPKKNQQTTQQVFKFHCDYLTIQSITHTHVREGEKHIS